MYISNIVKTLDLRKGFQKTIESIINGLDSNNKKCILLKYGYYNNKCYSNEEISTILGINISDINLIIGTFNRELIKEFGKKKPLGFFEWFKDFSMEEVLAAVDKLSEKEKDYLYKRYGAALNEFHSLPKNECVIFYTIKSRINRLLKNKKLRHYGKNIYEWAPGFSKEEFLEAIKRLTERERRILFKRFGQNLDEYNELTNAERTYLYGRTLPHLTELLKDKTKDYGRSPFYRLFKGFTKEEVLQVIPSLPEEYQQLIFKRYGTSLEEFNPISKEEFNKLHGKVKKSIYRLLNAKSFSNKSILDYFSRYSLDEIKIAVDKLPVAERKIVYKKFGENLDRYNPITHSERAYFSNTIKPKINDYLSGVTKADRKKPLFDFLIGYSKEDILEAISALPSNQRKIIYLRFGENLDRVNNVSSTDRKRVYGIVIPEIKTYINIKIIRTKVKNIYELYPEYSEEEVKKAMYRLSVYSRGIIYKRFGQNLNELKEINYNDFKRLYKVLNELTRYLPRNNKSFYELTGISKEVFKKRLKYLTKDEIENLYMRFGYDLDKPVYIPFDKSFIEYVDNIIISKLKSDTYEIIYAISLCLERITGLIIGSGILKEELIIFLLNIYQTEFEDAPYTLSDIMEYFNKSEEQIDKMMIKIIQKTNLSLEDIKNILVNNIDSKILVLGGKNEDI